MKTLPVAIVLLGTAVSVWGADVLPPGRTQRELREYLQPLVLPLELPARIEDWPMLSKLRRQRVLKDVYLAGVPNTWTRGGVNVVWGETIDRGDYVIRKLRYESVPGLWIGALLYEPVDIRGKIPGVLNPNGHEPKGMVVDYKQIRCINLAKRGMLALSTEFINMGQLRARGYNHNDLAHLDLAGCAGVSVFYLALSRALDVLTSHESIDLDRVAMTGLSGGGWQTIVLSSLDPRIRLAVPNAGYIGIGSRLNHPADIGDLEQLPTDLCAIADYPQLTALLAPRPALLIYNNTDDCCFPAPRAIPSVYEPVVPLYERLGAADRFALHVNFEPGTHNYLKDNREALYQFLNAHFVPAEHRIDEEIPCDDEVLPAETLAIEYPGKNADFFTLAEGLMESLPHKNTARVRERLERTIRPDRLKPARREGNTLKLGPDKWTLPLIEHQPDGDPKGTTLVITDRDDDDRKRLIRQTLDQQQRVVSVDVLFTGPCQPTDGTTARWAMMTASLGKRPLGIQVGQLDAVIQLLSTEGGLRLVTSGRVAGTAALTWAALNPGKVATLELHDMDASFKDLTSQRVSYDSAPSVFCFGLLSVADVPDMIKLAQPTRVTIAKKP